MIRLLDLLFPPRNDETRLRDAAGDEFLSLLSPALAPDTRPAATILFSFGDPLVRSAIHEAKYHGNRRAFQYLGLALAEYLRGLGDDWVASSHVVLVPVPLGAKRQKERGFNQVTEVIRAALAHLPLQSFTLDASLLKRVRETETQVSLTREKREQNMRGAFTASVRSAEQGRINPSATYVLIDDVLTTGATLQAAIDALRVAGAVTISPLALAH